ncbi:rho GTPase-activating protein 12a isoform X2 [Tachysurus fulvidraco]|uniref:rho GTPase-activating protein 12a isoform X2 n=1 Tax=Tachysurus fulvidraco TaxID=1234273 RepID=UPI000F50121B|nr:rho GTPase-activating protein 12a isoform X2 [Tachysurus fulvidraco]
MADRIDLAFAPGQRYIEVEYDYEYKSKDRMITIKQGECFLLVKKANEDWWQVRKEENSKPFYVPAQYVREVRRALMPPTKPLPNTGGGFGTRVGSEKKGLTMLDIKQSDESLNKQCPAQSTYAGYSVALQAPTEDKASPKSPRRQVQQTFLNMQHTSLPWPGVETPPRLREPLELDKETDRGERIEEATTGFGERERKGDGGGNRKREVEWTGDKERKRDLGGARVIERKREVEIEEDKLREQKREEKFDRDGEKVGDVQRDRRKERADNREKGRKGEAVQHKTAAAEGSPGDATEKNRSDLDSGDERSSSSAEQLQDLKISQSSLPPLPSSSPITTHAEWDTYKDANGRHFYCNRTTQERTWKPPRLRDSLGKRDEKHVTASTETEGSGTMAKTCSLDRRQPAPIVAKWRNSTYILETNNKEPSKAGTPDTELSDLSSPKRPYFTCEKSGALNVTKITEHGKKVRKNWTSSWAVLQGSQFICAKSQAMATSWFGSHQSKPEFSVDLKGATVEKASKEKSSKKHVLEVKTQGGTELLIQSDSESIINEWFKALNEAIIAHACESDEAIEEDMPESPGLEKHEKENLAQQKKTKTRLRKFLIRRPSLQAVKDKGYIKDLVFGCNLSSLCQREKTTVPHFVRMCIDYIEKEGLDLDGLYRVSGNLAVIQKLRFAVNHDEKINLADSKWEDNHVATGALKMFFRELPEPLFTYTYFNDFFSAIKITDYKQKVQAIKDLVKQLPQPNQDTMQELFKHLRKVIEHGEQNRMTTQSVAIVFGPTLLRPEIENIQMAVHMVYQNQIVELILHEYEAIFSM